MAINLDVLGELIRQLQADLRTVRAEVAALRAERADMLRSISDLIAASERRLMDRIADFEAHIHSRLDKEIEQ